MTQSSLLKLITVIYLFLNGTRASGNRLTLEIYRKSSSSKGSALTSDQLNLTQLQSESPSLSPNVSPAPVIHQSSRPHSYSYPYPYPLVPPLVPPCPSVKASAAAMADRNCDASLKVAFNKSIGGGILV